MTESGERETQDKSLQVSLTELEDLRRLKIVQEAKTELIAWGRQWAIIITITVSVVGLIGLNVVVATVIRGFVADDIKEAQKTAIVATEYLGKARTEMEKATKAATEYTEQVQQMKDRAEAVNKDLKTLEGKGRSVREETKLLTGDLQNRVEALEKSLASVIAQSSSESTAAKFRAETERLEREAAERRASFQTNSTLSSVLRREDPMARYKPIDLTPNFIPVDFSRQILPGSFEYALCHLIDHEIELDEFDARFRNDEVGAPAYSPGLLLKIVLLAYSRGLMSSRAIESEVVS